MIREHFSRDCSSSRFSHEMHHWSGQVIPYAADPLVSTDLLP